MGDATTLYDRDYYAWAIDQADKLRAWPEHLRPNGIDTENLAEEIESLAKREADALESHLRNLFLHLLKLEWHPDQRSREHWIREIKEFRRQVLKFGDKRPRRGQPKLWSERHEWAEDAWKDAVAAFCDDLQADGAAVDSVILAKLRADTSGPGYALDEQALGADWFPEFRGTTNPSPTPRRRKPAG